MPTDGDIVRRLLVFLEDRRALSSPSETEIAGWVVESVLRIREELTKTLQELAPESGANHSVRALRAACLTFLDRVGTPDGQWLPNFPIALGELRGVFAIYVRILADHYGITVHGPLAETLRAADLADEQTPEVGA